MSGDSYAAVWRTKWPSPYHFTVAMVLARYQNREGFCYMRQRKIAELAFCSHRQVGKVLQDMRTADPPQVQIVEQKRYDGGRSTNLVRLTLTATIDTTVDPLSQAGDFISEYDADPDAQFADGAQARESNPHTTDVLSSIEQDSNSKDSKQSQSTGLHELAQTAFGEWNETAERLGLPKAEVMTDARKRKLVKRLKEVGLDGWLRALGQIQKSKFLCGEVKTGKDGRAPFRCTIDFLLQASSFQKVLEGQYGEDRRVSRPDDASQAQAFQARMLGDRAFMLNLVTRWTQDAASWPALAGPAPGAPGCLIPGEIVARVTGEGPTGADALAMALQAHAPRAQVVTDDGEMIE